MNSGWTLERHKKIRILIADDHEIFRVGVTHLLKSQSDLQLIGEAEDVATAVERTRQLKPDVLLLDAAMLRRSGLVPLEELCGAPIRTKIVLLAISIDRDLILQTVQLGARGVLSKESPVALL